jgi:hypothetical protein
MTETQITVQYERKLSDGQYGSEGCSLTWTGPHDQDYGSIAAALRVQVLAFLSRSGAPEVAWKAKHELNPEPRDGVPVAVEAGDGEDLPF